MTVFPRPLPKCTVGYFISDLSFDVAVVDDLDVFSDVAIVVNHDAPSAGRIHYFAFFRVGRYCIDVTAQPQKGRSCMVHGIS